jgi:hypothetical protein
VPTVVKAVVEVVVLAVGLVEDARRESLRTEFYETVVGVVQEIPVAIREAQEVLGDPVANGTMTKKMTIH